MLFDDREKIQPYLADLEKKGYAHVALRSDGKSPLHNEWQHITYRPQDYYLDALIGCRGFDVMPIDVDDTTTSRMFAPLLQDWCRAHELQTVWDGRASKTPSHFFVRPVDADGVTGERVTQTDAFEEYSAPMDWRAPKGFEGSNPNKRAKLIEAKYHAGSQAMIPPSVHPSSGEVLSWYVDGVQLEDPMAVPDAPQMPMGEIVRLLRIVWVARILLPLWVEEQRHDLCLWAGSWLHCSGVLEADASAIFECLAGVADLSHSAGPDEFRKPFMADWTTPPLAGAKRKGWGGLAGLIGTEEEAKWWRAACAEVWPILGPGGGDRAVFSAAKDFASSTPVGVPLGSDASDLALERMRTRCTFIDSGSNSGWIHDLDTGKKSSVSSFAHRSEHLAKWVGKRRVPLHKRWLALPDTREAFDTVYLPQHPYGEIVDGLLNVFQESPVVTEARLLNRVDSVSDDDPHLAVVLAWIRRVFPIEKECELMCDWLSYLFRFPGQRPPWAIYSVAKEEGMGRGLIVALMARCLGRGNVADLDVEDVSEGWSDWATGKLLRHISESREPGQSRGLLVQKFKRVITNETVQVRAKHKGVVEVPNYGGYWLASNSVSDVHLAETTRRFCCLDNNGVLPTEMQVEEMLSVIEQREVQVAVSRWFLSRTGKLPIRPPATRTLLAAADSTQSEQQFVVAEATADLGECFTMTQAVKAFDGDLAHATPERIGQIRTKLRNSHYETLRGQSRSAGDQRVKYKGKYETVMCHGSVKAKLEGLGDDEIRKILAENDKNKPLPTTVRPLK